jgi:Peptidase S24-like
LKRAVKNNDRRGVTTETLMALAPVLKTTAAWLLEGIGDPTPGNLVQVVGRIGAGAEILPEFEQIPPEGLYEIEVPFPIANDAIAFQVEGDSMWPRYDPGDVIICWRQGTNVDEVIGWEAAVRTADGKRYLKRIQRGGASGTFDLESHNAAPIRGVRIEWAAEIKGVVRSGQWRRK